MLSLFKNTQHRSLLWLIMAQVMVGLNIVAAKLVLSDMPMGLILTIRFTFAALMLLMTHYSGRDGCCPLSLYFKKLTTQDGVYLILQALTAGIFFNSLMLYGLQHTDAHIAGIITSALPAIIALFAWIFLRENPGLRGLCSILLTTFGLCIIAGAQRKITTSQHHMFGDIMVFIALLPEAAYYVLCKIHRVNLPIYLLSGLINAINAGIMLIWMLSTHQPLAYISLHMFFVLFILSITSCLFYVFWFKGCQHVHGFTASLTTAVMPVASVIFAWILLGEQLGLLQGIGMGCILLSLLAHARK